MLMLPRRPGPPRGAAPSRIRGQGGFTLIATMLVMLVILLLMGAAGVAAISARGGATRDTDATRSLQAADASANIGLERLTQMGINSETTDKCVSLTGGAIGGVMLKAAITAGASWCPVVAVASPGASAAGYYVSKWTQNTVGLVTTTTRTIVGYATVGRSTRRVDLQAKTTTTTTATAGKLFGTFGASSYQDMTLTNAYYVSGTGVRSNGNITLDTTSPPTTNNCHVLGGNITPGVGKTVTYTNNATHASSCGGSDAPATSAMPAPTVITVPGTNDNGGIVNAGDVSWTASTKTLSMSNQASLTLTGNTYVFCSLSMANGTLNIAPTNKLPVKIYFAAPGTNGCSATVPQTQLSVQNQAVINNQTTLGAAGIQMYMIGSGALAVAPATPTTWADFNNNSQINATLYAPLSRVTIENQGGIKGAVYAEDLNWGGNNPYILWDPTVDTVTGGTGTPLVTISAYNQSSYAECTSVVPTAASPDTGC